jgi:hypothetical protein
MSKKRYDIGHLTNELAEGKSLFFSDRPGKQSATEQGLTRQQNPVVPERSNPRTPERSNGKRIITRNSFEIYEDQMDALRDRAYLEKRAGKIGSMSAMVRDAIDAFLKKS